MSTSAAAGDEWDRERERSRATQAKKSSEGRDIHPLPDVVNPERKAKAAKSFEFFCCAYFPNTFNLPWSEDHLEIIADVETVARGGGQKAYAMPRGSGKTSLAEAAVLWTTLYGYRVFPLVIGSDASSALEILESIKVELECNDELLADFPEVCFPIRRIEGIPHRCNGQLFNGERTHMHWSADGIVLPTIPGSKASGSIISVAGLTGRLRGMKFKRPDGTSIRPDLVLLDDPQTDESARSPSQCKTRKRLVNGAVLGLAGPGKKIAALMPCTVVANGDLSDEMLDRDKNPQWRGKRTAMVKSWPKKQKLWDEYADIRANDFRSGGEGHAATKFYAKNRVAMDEGFVVSWPARKAEEDVSGQQHAMNLRLDLGDVAFFAEYQNAPLIEQLGEEMLTAEEIKKKLNNHKRYVVPLGRDYITAFIDVQGHLLYYMVVAWSQDFTGSIIDYGAWPDQKTDYFSKRDARHTFKKKFPGRGQQAQIYAALESLTDELMKKEWIRDGDGAAMRISKCLIDANWGTSTNTIHLFCKQSKHAAIVTPSLGRYVRPGAKSFDEYSKRPGELLGNHWMLPSIKGKRAVRYVLFDTNFWKSFVHERFSVAMGDPGCLALWGKKPDDHQMLAEHLTAEYRKRVKAPGQERYTDEFKAKPGNPDNDLLDCLTGAAVAASMLGCKLLLAKKDSAAGPKKTKPKPRKKKVSYME